MKILFVCQYYSPEPFRHPDYCEQLVRDGHEVTVVTGLPNYPMGRIFDGYRNGKRRDEVINGVKVHRCFTVGRRSGVLFRTINYYSYAFSSSRYVKKLKGDFDVVLVNQLSPVLMARAAVAYKKKHGTPILLYCLDLWPESLTLGGIKEGSFLYRHYKKVSAEIYRSADKLLAVSRSFVRHFKDEFGITDAEYMPQYAEEIFDPETCRKAPDEYIDLMFAGNIGAAQSVDTVIEAAKLTSDVPNLRWHIVGDGSRLEQIKKQAYGMENVIFHGRKPLESMPEFYAMADAMLVTLHKNIVFNMTLPGKVQSYIMAGKPVIGAAGDETREVIENAGCGFCGAAENAAELAQNVRKFAALDVTQRQNLGNNATAYYKKYFNKKFFVEKLEKSLADLAGK